MSVMSIEESEGSSKEEADRFGAGTECSDMMASGVIGGDDQLDINYDTMLVFD